jgi:hypothetical protein
LATRYVVMNGEVYEADTLERIWPDRRAPNFRTWWDTGPAGSER